jgi:hypothetical protein
MAFAALIAIQAAASQAPALPERQRLAVDRFVSACVNGELTGADLRPIGRGGLPGSVADRFRDPAGRYYRFSESPASYLAITNDARPGARYYSSCALITPAGGPWALYEAVMRRVRPGTQTRLAGPGRPRGSRALAASHTNSEAGYTLQSVRVGRYTLLQTLQFRTKNDAPPPALPGRAGGDPR